MKYSNLVAITQVYPLIELKEFVDISLVAASYDSSTALFLNDEVITLMIKSQRPELQQSIDMLDEFSIPVYAEKSQKLSNLQIQIQSLCELKAQSQHHFIF